MSVCQSVELFLKKSSVLLEITTVNDCVLTNFCGMSLASTVLVFCAAVFLKIVSNRRTKH